MFVKAFEKWRWHIINYLLSGLLRQTLEISEALTFCMALTSSGCTERSDFIFPCNSVNSKHNVSIEFIVILQNQVGCQLIDSSPGSLSSGDIL